MKELIAARAGKFTEKNNVLYSCGDSGRMKLVVPVSLRRMLTELSHDSPTGGHRGIEKTVERLKKCYWWPRMKEDVQAYVRSCPDCARAKQPWPNPGDLQPLDVTKTFEYMHFDLVGPLPTTFSGSKYILNVVDRSSKRTVLLPLPNKEARTVARGIVKVILWHGSAPVLIQTDQGTEFVNAVVADMTHLLGISHVKGAAYHPQTNGQAERMNPEVEEYLAMFGDPEQRTWDANLDFAMYVINETKSSVTGETPNFLTFGRRSLEPIDLLMGVDPDPVMSREHWLDRLKKAREIAARATEEANRKMKERADKGKTPHDLKVGDTVWVKEKRTPPGMSPKLRPKAANVEYTVAELTGGGNKHAKVEAAANPRDQRSVHVDRLKRVVKEPPGIFGEPETTFAEGGTDEFEVERILDHRVGKSGKGLEYYIRWKGYGADEDQWVPATDVKADECVAMYELSLEAKKVRFAEPLTLTYAEVAKKATQKPSLQKGGKQAPEKGILRKSARVAAKGKARRG